MSPTSRNSTLITDRIFTPGLAQVAYVVADAERGVAAIIDPRRDIDAYLAWAEERSLRFVAILETHIHADFVSGGPELHAATGAPVYASRLGEVEYEHIPVDDGDVINVGSIRLRALFSPGHTPEHVAYLLLPDPESDRPVSLYSGDVLFVGDVGRPDLLGEEQTAALGRQLYDTVTNRLKTLPDDVVVYPGHTAGSSCGKKIGDAPSTTIGEEKRNNYAFRAGSMDEFVDMVLRDMPEPPAYYPQLKKVNKVGAPLLRSLSMPVAMGAGEVREAQVDGAMLIDIRSFPDFGAGHIPGTVFAGYGSNFHAWMGWLAPYDRDLILIGDGASIDDAFMALRQIGLDRVIGFLDGGIDSWDGERETLQQIDVRSLAEGLEEYDVLDVRGPDEWQQGHIVGAHHMPAFAIAQGDVPRGIGEDRPIAVICGSGYRSSVAASLLKAEGIGPLMNVAGGMTAWDEAGLPTTA